MGVNSFLKASLFNLLQPSVIICLSLGRAVLMVEVAFNGVTAWRLVGIKCILLLSKKPKKKHSVFNSDRCPPFSIP